MSGLPSGGLADADLALRTHGKTFAWARRFLGSRHAARATLLYAFCRHVDDLADESELPFETHLPPSLLGPLAGVALYGVMAICLVLAGVVGVLGTAALAPILGSALTGVAGLLLGGAGLLAGLLGTVLIGLFAVRWRRFATALGPAWEIARTGHRLTGRSDAIGETWRRVSDLYIALARSDIPAAAAADLRSGLRDVERRLESLAGVQDASTGAGGIDRDRLQARLDELGRAEQLTSEERAQRDQLVRTLGDVHEIDARRAGLERELSKLDDALDEVAAVLGRLGEGLSEDGLAGLESSTRLARELSAGLDAEVSRPREPVR